VAGVSPLPAALTIWVIDDGHSLPVLRGQADVTSPIILGAVRNSNTQITVIISERADHNSITKSSDGGFTVEKTGASGTTYSVSSIAAGTADDLVVLTVADMSSALLSGVTVKYTAGGNGTLADLTGGLMLTDSSGTAIAGWYGIDDVKIARDDNSNNLVLLNVGSSLEYATDATDTNGSGATWNDGTGNEIIISSSGKYVVVREKATPTNIRCLGYINAALSNQLTRTHTSFVTGTCVNSFAYTGIAEQFDISRLQGRGSAELDESKAKAYIAKALPQDFNSSGAINPAGVIISDSNLDIYDCAHRYVCNYSAGGALGITVHYYGANGNEGSNSADDEWFLPSAPVIVQATMADGGTDDYIDISDPSGDKIRIATVQSNASEDDYIWCADNGFARTPNKLDSNKQLLTPGNIFTNPVKYLSAGAYISVATEDHYTGNVFIGAGYGTIPAPLTTDDIDITGVAGLSNDTIVIKSTSTTKALTAGTIIRIVAGDETLNYYLTSANVTTLASSALTLITDNTSILDSNVTKTAGGGVSSAANLDAAIGASGTATTVSIVNAYGNVSAALSENTTGSAD